MLTDEIVAKIVSELDGNPELNAIDVLSDLVPDYTEDDRDDLFAVLDDDAANKDRIAEQQAAWDGEMDANDDDVSDGVEQVVDGMGEDDEDSTTEVEIEDKDNDGDTDSVTIENTSEEPEDEPVADGSTPSDSSIKNLFTREGRNKKMSNSWGKTSTQKKQEGTTSDERVKNKHPSDCSCSECAGKRKQTLSDRTLKNIYSALKDRRW